jgi:hypothetical protein
MCRRGRSTRGSAAVRVTGRAGRMRYEWTGDRLWAWAGARHHAPRGGTSQRHLRGTGGWLTVGGGNRGDGGHAEGAWGRGAGAFGGCGVGGGVVACDRPGGRAHGRGCRRYGVGRCAVCDRGMASGGTTVERERRGEGVDSGRPPGPMGRGQRGSIDGCSAMNNRSGGSARPGRRRGPFCELVPLNVRFLTSGVERRRSGRPLAPEPGDGGLP